MPLDLRKIIANASRWRRNLSIAYERLKTARRHGDNDREATHAAITDVRVAGSIVHALDGILYLAGVRDKKKRKRWLAQNRRWRNGERRRRLRRS